MAFVDLGLASDRLPAGCCQFLELPLTDKNFAQNAGRCWQLLRLFKQTD